MASKYLQQFPIPPEFPNILRDLTREILRLQPQDIIVFAAEYFKCKQAGKEFIWDEANPRAPRPCDYPKIIRKEPEKVAYSTKPGSEPRVASQIHQSHEGKQSSGPKSQDAVHEKKKSGGSESRDIAVQEKKSESKFDEKHSKEAHHQVTSETRQVITESRQIITETRHEIHIEHSEEHHERHESHHRIEESKEHHDSMIPSLASPSEAAAKEYVEGLVDRVEKRISVQP
eukprot:CAMPEP_0202949164 /NCGR_PEP_ID=MMETSP1395-20130829/15032_1 /ASSEMBLY_ACC=CAM_ASM_000871 /TAXON_ID=5961 /ORGANISM="Blepharisma japonicum, Strain Stock R1072" /LENGTH=229 /DNA_ID=CAMNT_0049651941 /DNA_START=1 /DNA_END=690 /DNA_ORIENTATION=+